jgi:hypothetical protein
MYTFIKVFLRQIYSYNFYICKLSNLKVIDNLYSQCLTQTLSKTTSKSDTEGICLQFGELLGKRPESSCLIF